MRLSRRTILVAVSWGRWATTDAFVATTSASRTVGWTTSLRSSSSSADVESSSSSFSLDAALFSAGLAFDAYVEPSDRSRWERGPQGLNVAFQSDAFARSLYNGLLEITAIRADDLPDEDDTAEALVSGGGVDAYLTVAVVEGHVETDVRLLDEERHHAGVRDLRGSAHAGRSTTAWSNVDRKEAAKRAARGGDAAYHVPSTWTKGGAAVWEDDPPFYLYVQNPADARLVFTVADDDVLAVGEGDGNDDVIGSASRKLTELLPGVDDFLKSVAKKLRGRTSVSPKDVALEWRGTLPLDVIPRKKDKGGQVAMGAMAGAMVAGPAGAAVGGFLGNVFEGLARGKIEVRLRYLPLPDATDATKTNLYEVKGGLPGVEWGTMYRKRRPDSNFHEDLELCASVRQDRTGCACAVYRSPKSKLIAVSFRGTCELVDLVTDASIVQTPWTEGEDPEDNDASKVHVGFRNSLDSVSRRVKELILAAVPPSESIADHSLLVTGHSLGGALATLFTADVAEHGLDAGRGLPQLEPSEPWWGFFDKKKKKNIAVAPPRPKDVRLYSFGSPRVGNEAFVAKFDDLVANGSIKEAYRVVNGEDVVARLPRTVNALGVVKVGYEHCGATALVSPKTNETDVPLVWVEGESDDARCPVRDGTTFVSPLADGSLLGDLVGAVRRSVADNEETSDTKGDGDGDAAKQKQKTPPAFDVSKLGSVATELTGRIRKVDAKDLMGVLGIESTYVDREAKIFNSIFSGEAIGHHMEDKYYAAMGRACGYDARVGEEIRELERRREDNDDDARAAVDRDESSTATTSSAGD